MLVPWALALEGDNPMQSELACHVGLTGKFFCQNCMVKGCDAAAEGADNAGGTASGDASSDVGSDVGSDVSGDMSDGDRKVKRKGCSSCCRIDILHTRPLPQPFYIRDRKVL